MLLWSICADFIILMILNVLHRKQRARLLWVDASGLFIGKWWSEERGKGCGGVDRLPLVILQARDAGFLGVVRLWHRWVSSGTGILKVPILRFCFVRKQIASEWKLTRNWSLAYVGLTTNGDFIDGILVVGIFLVFFFIFLCLLKRFILLSAGDFFRQKLSQ